MRQKKRKFIIVVDDESDIRDFLVEFLQDEGFDSEGFGVARDAVDRHTEKKADLIISDLQLQGASGLDLLRMLKLFPGQTPVIIMSGGVNAGESARRAGAAVFLHKPFDLDDVLIAAQRLTKKFD